MLAKANHFYVQQEPTGGYSGTTIGGRTTLTPDSYEHHVHVPCPHCGERKPMVWTLGKTFYRLVGIPAGAFLFLYALGHLGRHLNWW
jgi:phage terminase large subunit GpA-like protein